MAIIPLAVRIATGSLLLVVLAACGAAPPQAAEADDVGRPGPVPIEATLAAPEAVVEADPADPPRIDPALVLPFAQTVVVLHARRVVELKLNGLLLLLARKYLVDDCVLRGVIGIERVMASENADGWAAVIEGRDAGPEWLRCLSTSPVASQVPFRDGVAFDIGAGVLATVHDDRLLVGSAATLTGMFAPRSTRDPVAGVLRLVPDRDDLLLALGASHPIAGASSGFIAGDLDRLTLHVESRRANDDLARLAARLPLLRLALRGVLAERLPAEDVALVMQLLDNLAIEQRGERLTADLVIEDVQALIDALVPAAATTSAPAP